MATLEVRNGWYRLVYRFDGIKRSKSLKTRDQSEANFVLAKLEKVLKKIVHGQLDPPKSGDPIELVMPIPKKQRIEKTEAKSNIKEKKKKRVSLTIRQAWQRFLDALPYDALEESTTKGMATHIDHLSRLIGGKVVLRSISKPILQDYIDKRSKEPGRRNRSVSVQTIKKELRTFSTIWNWAKDEAMVKKSFPSRKLRYPKFEEKPPFQTIKQIQSKINRFGLDEFQQAELWECVFLDVQQVQQVLDFVKQNLKHPVFYPMLCVAAFTGARRSEIMRSQLCDLDFESQVITIREKKRMRGRLSTRQVPMPQKLLEVLEEWLDNHPGTEFTFAETKFGDSKPTSISNDQASNFFQKAFVKSEWEFLPGWHTFRHSFCSNAASAGVEQRIINQWTGHMTEEMVRRYRHLFPSKQQEEIAKIFG